MQKEEQEKLKAAEEEKYYSEHFEEIMLNKIASDEKLTERELSTLVFENETEREKGDSGRWSQHMTSIVELCGRHFAIDWQRGLTEMQENEFYNQPYEVELKEYEKLYRSENGIRLKSRLEKI